MASVERAARNAVSRSSSARVIIVLAPDTPRTPSLVCARRYRAPPRSICSRGSNARSCKNGR
jgi:hypothetical protein